MSTDYILIGKEPNSESTENKMETKCKVEKKTYIPISKKALSIIAIIGSTAVITIIFIAALTAIAFFIKRRK
ncbi:hypothetical protein N072000002_07570 [Clostridium tetani]|uniref:Uncharacterized protein n=1 Tax=Clostridium tetani TaxID=1513 RepID=A0ABC8EBD8_CLOTA|nr:hypothetical protein [Clostridium tetani]BDR80501.1 hypothetical protein K234311028_07470 [Clostridium tetani]BDR88956.1 hypothetical protein N072000002_07570 [Clostridium tetani]